MLEAVDSVNHTAPSGATASRPSFAIGVDRGKVAMAPDWEMWAMARTVASVYHAEPSAAAASPMGSRFCVPLVNRSIFPWRQRPMASDNSMVNQMAPSGAAATAVGISLARSIRYSMQPGADLDLERQTIRPRASS